VTEGTVRGHSCAAPIFSALHGHVKALDGVFAINFLSHKALDLALNLHET
jgi:hypothetical protein